MKRIFLLLIPFFMLVSFQPIDGEFSQAEENNSIKTRLLINTNTNQHLEKDPQESKKKQEAFSYLETLKIANNRVVIKYDQSVATIINKKLGDLDGNHPLKGEGPAEDDILVMEFKINKKANDKFALVFTFGPSDDPAFNIYSTSDYKFLTSVPGTEIILPGNNSLYAAGRENNSFFKKSKFVFKQNKFEEVAQPFYYVGLQTTTLKAVKLYSDKELSTVLAYLPANYVIEVLLAEPTKTYTPCKKYLVKTAYGLVGWIEVETYQFTENGLDIKGLEFLGD